jgi:hypothetical protein
VPYADPEAKRAYDRTRYLARRELVLAASREYRNRPGVREARAEYNQSYRQANADRVREHGRRWRAANAERIKENKRRYQQANAETIREYAREWAAANRDRIAARYRGWAADLKTAVFGYYGETCACCGTTDQLCIDHINGDGKQHRQQLFGRPAGATVSFYLWLIREGFPQGFQTLCKPCNSSKSHGERCRLQHGEV